MPTWNSEQYLKFASERTQPSIDLVTRIALSSPRRIVDLGCGPGNSTAVVARRWPEAEITGVDNSAAMLEAARREFPQWHWRESDITRWASAFSRDASSTAQVDLVFSNAALQWVPDHAALLPRLLGAVVSGGALAFQIPHSLESPHQRGIRDLAASATWRKRFNRLPVSWQVESPEFYYDALAPHSARIDLWLTEYQHVLSGPEGVVEWHRGTGLRPFLEALPDADARAEFEREYLAAILPAYPRRADGKVLMGFRRLFVIAYR
jgi:trans-aconitate 2-methyltransferase